MKKEKIGENKNRTVGVVDFVLGIILAISPYTFLKVCEVSEDMVMKCHWTAQVITGIGIVIALVGLLAVIATDIFRSGLILSEALLGALTIAVPTVLIGVCGSIHMHCHSVARPGFVLIGAVLILVNVVISFLTIKNNSNKAKEE